MSDADRGDYLHRPTWPYKAGDTYSYRSVTRLHIVTWSRDDQGNWHADDDRGMTANDEMILAANDGTEPNDEEHNPSSSDAS